MSVKSRTFTLRLLLLITLACGLVLGGGQLAWTMYGLPNVEERFWLLLVGTYCYFLVGGVIGLYIRGQAGAAIGGAVGLVIAISPLVYFFWQVLSW